MTVDPETLTFYDREAAAYSDWTQAHALPRRLTRLASDLPAGARVLDLGCGAGWAARWLREQGFAVTALDPSQPLLDRLADRDIATILGGALDLEADGEFDAIWSNCALQHLPRDEMPGAISRIGRALAPGGRLLLALHEGDETLRDGLGRLYCHWSEAALTALLRDAGMTVVRVSRASDKGYDGRPITILQLEARRDD